jgi:hypothetical protein
MTGDQHRYAALYYFDSGYFRNGGTPNDVIHCAYTAAMAYVDAYLWEFNQQTPRSERQRKSFVGLFSALQPINNCFKQLFNYAGQLSYVALDVATAILALNSLQDIDILVKSLLP